MRNLTAVSLDKSTFLILCMLGVHRHNLFCNLKLNLALKLNLFHFKIKLSLISFQFSISN